MSRKHRQPASKQRYFSGTERYKEAWRHLIDVLPNDEVKTRFTPTEYDGRTAAISIESMSSREMAEQKYENRYDEDEVTMPRGRMAHILKSPPFLPENQIRLRRFAETRIDGITVKHPETFGRISDAWWEWEAELDRKPQVKKQKPESLNTAPPIERHSHKVDRGDGRRPRKDDGRQRAKCPRCRHDWWPISSNPKQCPMCKYKLNVVAA